MTHKHGQWYIKKDGDITGPFNGSVITNHLIIGRLSMADEVSADKKQWLKLEQETTLHPDLDDPEKIRRRLDERTGLDRRSQQTTPPPEAKQRKGDRRAKEADTEADHRQLRRTLMQKYRDRHQRIFMPMLVTFVVLTGLTVLAVLYPTTIPTPLPNCMAPAAPEVNWNNCLKADSDLSNADLSFAKLRNSQLSGTNLMNAALNNADIAYANLNFANLSYADLQNASLVGANLSQADLTNAVLTQADLSYTDLSNANIANAKLDGAKFDHSIWINGQRCGPDSIGGCVFLTE
jgi:uncharacterized protein YjbI with pentapeptide repeats